MMGMSETRPRHLKPLDVRLDTASLAAGRYGTYEMIQVWGPEKTFEYSLYVQGQSALTLSEIAPEEVHPDQANHIVDRANLKTVSPERIRELEDKTGHDIIAINTALGEVVIKEAASHINKFKTSADTSQPAKALQIKESLEIIAESVENLRDIVLEKSVRWIDVPHMDVSHLYDALPTVAGRPFSHYAEMLQSNLNILKYVYDNSVMGKWADATGNHHSATSVGLDGILIQERFCRKLGLKHMTAPAQIPGLEFEADIFYVLARTGETVNNIAKYVAWGRGDDVNIFFNSSPKKKKGSSAMPHKDAKNGNPTVEEQNMSMRNYNTGNLVTAMMNCEMPYARNLAASSNARINFEDSFKYTDHAIRRLANTVYWLGLNKERSIERVQRSYGCPTSQIVMTYLTSPQHTSNPMTRDEAHDLMGALATFAWKKKIQFTEVLLRNDEVTSRLDFQTITDITDPLRYIGKSKEIVRRVFDECYKAKTLDV
jgi:adenylosuccinate lyase